jgi:hypothetical protein
MIDLYTAVNLCKDESYIRINGEEYTIHAYGWYGDNYSHSSQSFVWNYEDYNVDPDVPDAPSKPNKPD